VDGRDGYYERYAAQGSHTDYFDDVGDHMYSMAVMSTRFTIDRRYRSRGDGG
jgi:hypothetical protein